MWVGWLVSSNPQRLRQLRWAKAGTLIVLSLMAEWDLSHQALCILRESQSGWTRLVLGVYKDLSTDLQDQSPHDCFLTIPHSPRNRFTTHLDIACSTLPPAQPNVLSSSRHIVPQPSPSTSTFSPSVGVGTALLP